MDRITAGDHEVFEDTDGEFQGLVRLEVQSTSSFDSARLLVDQRGGSLVAFVSTP